VVNPIVHLYVAVAARAATPVPTPHIERPVPGRPSPNPVRPYHGFHFRHGYGGYGPDGTDTSTVLLIAIGVGAVVLALAAWLFLIWRQKRRPGYTTVAPGSFPTSGGTFPGAPGDLTGTRPRFPRRRSP
jgi:hypothetical protein